MKMKVMICGVNGKECMEKTSAGNKKPCKSCEIGKKWLAEHKRTIVLHDEK